MGMRRIDIIGNLGNDPDVRFTQDGLQVTTFSVATALKKASDKEEKPVWFRVVTFDKLAEIAGKYLKKGKQVFVSGTLTVEEWKDKKTGENRFSVGIQARDIQMLGSKSDNGNGADHPEDASQKAETPDETGNDIPF